MNKNILEFCLSPDLGGLELFVVNCYNYFKQKTNTFFITQKDAKLDNYLNDKKYYIKRNKFFPIIPAIKLAKFIDKNSIDIIHFHWTKDMPIVVLAKLLSKQKPKIIQTRNMHITRFKDDFYHKFLYKNIDCIHAVTYEVKEELTKFIPSSVRPKIETIYMGVKLIENEELKIENLRKKYKIKKDDFVVGIIGRIEAGKGQWILIEAIKNLKNINIKALIVGHTMDEEYLNNLKSKIKNYGIEDKIIFSGFTKEVNEHIKLCDVTVLATKNETFGLVVVESMINSIPVIATNKGGPREIIEDRVDGMLFDRSVDDLTKKIKFLYENKDLLKEMGKKAKIKAVEKFEYNKQLEKLWGFINAC